MQSLLGLWLSTLASSSSVFRVVWIQLIGAVVSSRLIGLAVRISLVGTIIFVSLGQTVQPAKTRSPGQQKKTDIEQYSKARGEILQVRMY